MDLVRGVATCQDVKIISHQVVVQISDTLWRRAWVTSYHDGLWHALLHSIPCHVACAVRLHLNYPVPSKALSPEVGRRSATVHVLQDKLFALCLADGVSICLLCLAGQCTAMMSGSASSSSCLARRFCQKLKRQRSRNLKNVQGLHRYLLLACS